MGWICTHGKDAFFCLQCEATRRSYETIGRNEVVAALMSERGKLEARVIKLETGIKSALKKYANREKEAAWLEAELHGLIE